MTASYDQVCAALTNGTCEACVANLNCVYCVTDQSCRYPKAGFPSAEDCSGGLDGVKWLTCLMNLKFLLITFACITLLLLVLIASCAFYCVRRARRRRADELLASLGIPLPRDCELELYDEALFTLKDGVDRTTSTNGKHREKSNGDSQKLSDSRKRKERAFDENVT